MKTHANFELASLRRIDPDLFRAVSDNQHFDNEPKWLALEWFRKGLAEKHTLDEFIAYWSALELAATSLKMLYASLGEKSYPYCPACKHRIEHCPHCGVDAGSFSPWAGVFHLIDQGIGIDRKAFSAIRKFRGGMLHGGTDLSNDAVERMKAQNLPLLRRLVVFVLAALFQFPDELAERIANQTVHRVATPLTTKISGTLALPAEPPSIERVDMQPTLSFGAGSETHIINPDGTLSIQGGAPCKPIGANFKLSRTELWADRGAGIMAASLTLGPKTTA